MGIKKPKLKAGKTTTFVANPYYDEILIFAGVKVPTSQEGYKLVDSKKQLYKRIKKPNVKRFQSEIKGRLLKKKKPWWPHTEKLSLIVSVGGPKNYIEFSDLDNYLKTIFDAIKGVVIADDHQIIEVTVDKEENQFVSGFIIAIKRELKSGEEEFVYDPDNWQLEGKLKLERGGICCMDDY